jgi:hypothetical protein
MGSRNGHGPIGESAADPDGQAAQSAEAAERHSPCDPPD